MSRLLRHLRGSAIAYLALFVALGGTSYAALGDPIDGGAIKNHTIQPVKFDPHLIGGVVRVWAIVGADGHLQSGSPGAVSGSVGQPGVYGVVWRRAHARFQRCAGLGTVIGTAARGDGFVTIQPVGDGAYVHTYNPQGQPTSLPFSVTIVC